MTIKETIVKKTNAEMLEEEEIKRRQQIMYWQRFDYEWQQRAWQKRKVNIGSMISHTLPQGHGEIGSTRHLQRTVVNDYFRKDFEKMQEKARQKEELKNAKTKNSP